MNRREFLRRITAFSILTGISLTGIVELAKLGAFQSNQATFVTTSSLQSGSSSSSPGVVPSGYVQAARLSDIANHSSVYFNHPQYGNSLLLNFNGQWRGFSATCTHRPCTVEYQGSTTIYCPCHGATFSPSDGSVLGGPAPTSLPEYDVRMQNGDLYVSISKIN
jgi:Rieske Fe-S protein